MEEWKEDRAFPPKLAIGNRVWRSQGCGAITAAEQPYMTMDQVLYTIQWDSGEVSKHYSSNLLGIGHFRSREEFEKAIVPPGAVELTVGPRSGFGSARLE